MKPDHSSPQTVAERFRFGTNIRRIDRRILVLRMRETLLRRVATPALGVLATVFFLRTVKIGALLDIRTAGTAATLALLYGMFRAARRRLLREAEDLECARSPIPASERTVAALKALG
jgi:hypothetical protein